MVNYTNFSRPAIPVIEPRKSILRIHQIGTFRLIPPLILLLLTLAQTTLVHQQTSRTQSSQPITLRLSTAFTAFGPMLRSWSSPFGAVSRRLSIPGYKALLTSKQLKMSCKPFRVLRIPRRIQAIILFAKQLLQTTATSHRILP